MTHEHIVSSFEEELSKLDQMIAEMGGLTERQLTDAINALVSRDTQLSSRAIAADSLIDELERNLEEHAIVMIARRQPVALDLRQIMAANRIASDLERIGDLSKNLAKRAMTLNEEVIPAPLLKGLQHMTELAQGQLKDVLDAYASRDLQLARRVWEQDEDIDNMYNSLFRELLTYMMENPRNIGLCTHLLFVAKNIERLGDHTTNIAETTHYLVKGETMTDDRPKGDVTSSIGIGELAGAEDGSGD